jgi:hypothetical protein
METQTPTVPQVDHKSKSPAPAAPALRDRASGVRALVSVLGVVAFVGLTLVLSYTLDIFTTSDPEDALGMTILGLAILILAGGPLLVVLLLPSWRRAVAAPLRPEGQGPALGILRWSVGLCGVGMLYALRNLLRSDSGSWQDLVDEEITLLALLALTLAAFVAFGLDKGWAKVLARIVFIVFFIPWLLYNPIGAVIGLGIMFFGLRSLRDVQPQLAPAPAAADARWSPDGSYWWDGTGWRHASPDRRQYWDGLGWRAIIYTDRKL